MAAVNADWSKRCTDPGQIAVSVVLACRNAERYLAHQLGALAAQSCLRTWELVISDNGSTDRSIAIAEQYRPLFPRMLVVDSSASIGPGAARNAGVRAARGDHLLFCDADDEVGPGWLIAMSDALDGAGIVAARLEHELLNEPWAFHVRKAQAGLLNTNPPFFPYAYCAALGVQRAVHDRIGGFNETYFDGGEDRDYCYRAQLSGAQMRFVAEAVVHYRHRQTALEMYRQARGYGRGIVRIYRDYRHLGLQRPSVVRGIASWVLVVIGVLPALTSRQRLAKWMARLGWRVGALQGSLRCKVWAL